MSDRIEDWERALSRLTEKLDEVKTILVDHVATSKSDLADCKRRIVALEGDVNPMILDVDRLKQIQADRTRVMWGIISTVTALMINAIWKFFHP